jgi:hypothetical protein
MASPNNTVVNAGSGGSITDSVGNVWTITFAGQIAINGTVDPVTNNVLQLAYVNGVVWQYTGYGLWYSYSNADGSWTESATSPLPAAPAPSSTPSPNNTVINAGSGGSITDSTGNVWTITPSGQIAVNGAVDPVTNNVLQLAYVSNVVWQYTGYDIWYSYSATDGTWTESATSPLPVGTPPTAPTLTAGIATQNSVPLTWTNAGGGVIYQVQFKQHSATTWSIFTAATASLSATVTGLAASTSYDFWVVATNTAGAVASNQITAITAAPAAVIVPPSAPTGVVASNVRGTSVDLSWTASTGTAPITYQPRYQGHVANPVSTNYAVATPGAGSITDTHSTTWAVTSSGQITVNGAVDSSTGSVARILYVNGVIWQIAPPFGWYKKTLPSDTWTFDSAGPVSPNATIVSDTTGVLVDANGYVVQLTAGGQIKVDGVIDGVTNGVTQIEYFGGQIWQLAFGGWYRKTLPTGTWVPSANAPGVVGAGTTPVLLGAQLSDPAAEQPSHTYFDQFRSALGEGPTVFTTYAIPDECKRDGNGYCIGAADWSPVGIWQDVANYSAHGINVMNGWSGAAPVTIPLVGLTMAQFANAYGHSADQDFAAIQSGAWDYRLDAIYQAYVDHGFTTIYSRPGFEMNGDWFAWSVRPDNSNAAAFAATFRHIANHAYNWASAHGITIKMVWNPGYLGDAGSQARPDYTLFYPGDAYVDHIGIDTYGTCSGVGDNGPLLTFPTNNYFGLDDAIKMSIAKGKPLCFPEIGCGPGETTFQNNVRTRMIRSPDCKVSFVSIWDQPTGCGNYPSGWWSTDGNSGAAWKAMFNAIRDTNGPW